MRWRFTVESAGGLLEEWLARIGLEGSSRHILAKGSSPREATTHLIVGLQGQDWLGDPGLEKTLWERGGRSLGLVVGDLEDGRLAEFSAVLETNPRTPRWATPRTSRRSGGDEPS